MESDMAGDIEDGTMQMMGWVKSTLNRSQSLADPR